ncbi:hypothetical protein [Aurantimonas sp. VKM B-3413]|uniref:hypothetical protein n=1 Tax=Aurantimonas sp. VKM B-3413 TaxID=2779401 RepID=UPI001E56ACC3|nr:hypothetical protein [Aurantimonas sp. VKM B-3413]MCB8839491.1 hypothetical protein [Aurantimonas sp. VKM B-3413]
MSRMEILADWLARSEWQVWEAAALLAGICPERSRMSNVQANDWACLPGRKIERRCDISEAKWIDAQVEDEIERKRGRLINVVPGGADAAESPQQILKRAKRGDFLPAWLQAAQDDPGCRQFLPTELRRSQKRPSVSEANQAKRRQQLADDPKQQLLNFTAREIFERMAAEDFRDQRIAFHRRINVSKVAEKIHGELQARDRKNAPSDIRAISNRVSKWLKGLEMESADRKSESTQPRSIIPFDSSRSSACHHRGPNDNETRTDTPTQHS